MNAWFEEHIILFYVVIDEFTKQYAPPAKDPEKMSDAEVLFTALFAAWFCSGKIESARRLLGQKTYIPSMLSKSRLCRRIHELSTLLPALFYFLSQLGVKRNPEKVFLVDTFPIPVCHNIRISRSKIYKDKAFRGYTKSKRSFFYGLKLLLVTTKEGQVIQLALAPGSTANITMLQDLR